ncbi:hypothetical protein [Paucimonas lemoignei]|uniref:hypothetical protein n=1 Tax=Paucimonas lemoignei TaxID=29443 RepID=UPI00105340C8|nr:hypothetical protein [Paucimonas lemoignei]
MPYLLITIVVLLAHGLLVFNNGVFWDDWLVKGFLDDGNWYLLRDMTSEMGLPILAYFFGGLKLFGLSDHFKTVALLLIIFSAFCIYQAGSQTSWLSRPEALLIAIVSAVYPAFQTTVLLSTLQYLFFYFLFLFAILLSFIAEKNSTYKSHKVLLALTASLLFFLSFNLNSLLVYYFPFLALLSLYIKEQRQFSWTKIITFISVRRAHLVVLPFAYWVIKKLFFPTHGLYEKYNALDLNAYSAIIRIRQTITTAAHKQTSNSLYQLLELPFLWGALLVSTYVLYSRFKSTHNGFIDFGVQIAPHKRESKWLFVFGLLLLVSGIFPYAMAGIVPSTSGWNTRHSLLIGLPMAVLIAAALRYLCNREFKSFHNKSGVIVPELISALVASSLIFAFVISSISFYVDWQARAIKDQSVREQLSQQIHLKPFSIYWIKDDFLVGGDTYYNFYEWSSMFKKIWGGQSRIAMQLEYLGRPISHKLPPPKVFSNRYNLAEFNPKGRQICLNIRPGFPELSKKDLVLQYFYLRARAFFYAGSQTAPLNEFLNRAARIDTKVISTDEAALDPAEVCSRS